ncbi:hypothetical protein [Spirosoma utsteinense]|uniref:Uncharacterized protein n=1 Tax=Spirosoma utsteinense TaxID=2585773 RepID=A0ABR6W7W4_9BACT|nr:hypothetical protein [Spirosoma utsteinense]MBC3787551.1 hypothetical protein [Spirosoma utsteinense]MBC3792238.1 hypothetical protein [Spirosoma utsteinense]
MKEKSIRFFSLQENLVEKTTKPSAKTRKLEGFISSTGKLVFPAKTIDQLELEADSVRFRIGTPAGKRKITSLYLLPTHDPAVEAFPLKKAAKSYTIGLRLILQNGEVDYSLTKYKFTIEPVDFEEGVVGYELKLQDEAPKPAYTGKPRGRKPKAA